MKKNSKKILIFNWKMNPTTKSEVKKLFTVIKKAAEEANNTQIIIAPPAIYMESLIKTYKGRKIFFSGQDTFHKESGSYTGVISPTMFKDIGAEYSIVGHYERRNHFGETDSDISDKIQKMMDVKLKAIVCVGEHERDTKGNFITFIENQIINALKGIEAKELKNIIFAYEPVWAIGAKVAMTRDDIESSILLIRKKLIDIYGKEGGKVKITYGGSVNLLNISHLLESKYIDGFLIGRSGIEPKALKEFMEIVK